MAESGIDSEIFIDDLIPRSPERHAESKKETGNHLYKLKDYKGALSLYEEAINLCPENAAYYGNRSACFMMLGNYSKALEDAQNAVQLDPNFTKGYIRIAKCCIALGDILGAEQAIKAASALGGAGVVTTEVNTLGAIKHLENEAEKAEADRDFRRIVYCMDRILDQCPASIKAKLRKAECLAQLGRYQEAQEIASDSLRFNKVNPDAIYVRGVCLYYQDNVEQAFKHFQQVLRLAPDHSKAVDIYKRAKLLKQMKEEGNEAFKSGKWQDAFNFYEEALKIDPNNKTLNSKLFYNKATVCAKMNRLKEAVSACSSALLLDDTYLKALLRRAKCYADLGEHEDAVRDYEKALKMDKSKENKHLLHEAKAALKRSKRKDYYKILGIDKNASVEDIKKAYRKRAMVHHPDRHAGAPDMEKREQERRFKEVGEAYGVLSDPKKRARYDHGQDLDDGDGLTHDIDPNMMFQAFFGGPPPGGNSQYNFQGSGFQNGFTFQFG